VKRAKPKCVVQRVGKLTVSRVVILLLTVVLCSVNVRLNKDVDFFPRRISLFFTYLSRFANDVQITDRWYLALLSYKIVYCLKRNIHKCPKMSRPGRGNKQAPWRVTVVNKHKAIEIISVFINVQYIHY